MTDGSVSRRAVLKTSAGGLATAVTSGLAGCSAIPGFGGDGGTSGSARIENWAFARDEVGDDEDLYTRFVDLGRIRDLADALPDEYVEAYDPAFVDQYGDPVGVDWADMDWFVRVGRPLVVRADHDVSDVVERLTEEFDYAVGREDLDGYTSLIRSDSRAGYAVDGSRILWADDTTTDDVADVLETMVATQRGEVDMAVDENEDFVAALDAVGGDTISTSPRIASEDVGARANDLNLGRDTTRSTLVWVYEDEDDFDEDDLRENDPFDADGIRFEGRKVIREWEFDTETIGQGS